MQDFFGQDCKTLLREVSEANGQQKSSLHGFGLSSFKPVVAPFLKEMQNSWEDYLAELYLDHTDGKQMTLSSGSKKQRDSPSSEWIKPNAFTQRQFSRASKRF